MTEELYDAEIAPLLLDAMKRCENAGMGFVAIAEYAPEEYGSG